MEMEPANRWAHEKLQHTCVEDLIENLPPVSFFSLADMKTCSFRNRSDLERFEHIIPPDLLINKAGDDLEPVMPLLLKGLTFGIKDLCNGKSRLFFKHFGIEPAYSKRLIMFIYRCVGKLIENAEKHAGAENIFVELITEDDFLSATVQDDGAGFDFENIASGKTLLDMAASVVSLGGQFHIYISEGMGAEISIEIENPLESDD